MHTVNGSGKLLDTWKLETDATCPALDDPTPLTVQITFDLPAPVRVENFLMHGLGLSRTTVRRLIADGRIHLSVPPASKAHRDFELTIAGARQSVSPAPQSHRRAARGPVVAAPRGEQAVGGAGVDPCDAGH